MKSQPMPLTNVSDPFVTLTRQPSLSRRKPPAAERTPMDYFFIVKKRLRLVVLVAALLFAAASIMILMLPATYRADVLVLFQAPTVSPGGMVTLSSDIGKKMDVLREQVESRKILDGLIKKFDLYSASRGAAAPDAIYDVVRKSIALKMGKSSFNLYFDHEDPFVAAEVANDLAQQYIEENTRLRKQSLNNTRSFLQSQLARLEREVRDMEQVLQEFRFKHAGSLPQDVPANQALLTATSTKVSQAEANLDSDRLRKRKTEDRVREILVAEIATHQKEIARLTGALRRFPNLDDDFELPEDQAAVAEQAAEAALALEQDRKKMHHRLAEVELALARQKAGRGEAGTELNDAEVARLKAEQEDLREQLDKIPAAPRRGSGLTPPVEAPRAASVSTASADDDVELETLRERLREREAAVRDAQRNVEDMEQLYKRQMVSKVVLEKAKGDLERAKGELRIRRTTAKRTRTEMMAQLQKYEADLQSLSEFQNYWNDMLVKVQEIEAQRLRISGRASEDQVRSASARIEALSAELAQLRDKGQSRFERMLAGRGELGTQAREHENSLTSIARQQKEIQDDRLRAADLERRLINSAKVAVELPEMERKYHTITEQYNAMLRQKLESEIAMGVEDQQQGERMVIWDPAIPTSRPFRPKYSLLFTGSLLMSVGAAVALALLLELLSPKFLSADSVHLQTGANVLANIEHLPQGDVPKSLPSGLPPSAASIMTLSDPWHQISRQFMDIACVLFKPHEKWPRVVAVCSPSKGDGKTFVAANLAGALAISSREPTLLIDANLRAPSLHTLFGKPQQAGLAEALEQGPIHVHPISGSLPGDLQLMTAGSPQRHGPVLLGSARFREIMERLTYDGAKPRIVLDTPPLHAGADVDVLLDTVDGVLLVVRRGQTQIADVERALRRLRPDKLIGIIFNDDLER